MPNHLTAPPRRPLYPTGSWATAAAWPWRASGTRTAARRASRQAAGGSRCSWAACSVAARSGAWPTAPQTRGARRTARWPTQWVSQRKGREGVAGEGEVGGGLGRDEREGERWEGGDTVGEVAGVSSNVELIDVGPHVVRLVSGAGTRQCWSGTTTTLSDTLPASMQNPCPTPRRGVRWRRGACTTAPPCVALCM